MHDGINTNNETIAYLDLLDFDTKYISASFEDTRQDLDVLEEISNNRSISLPKYYRSKLNYLLATEYYYYYFGDTINPTLGIDDDQYQSDVKPMLKKALKHINLAENFERKASNYALMARIEHELKNYVKAKELANKSYQYAQEKYGGYHAVTDKSLVAKYSVNRFNNLTETIEAAELLVQSIAQQEGYKDDWLYASYLLNNAYLSAGDFEKSQQVLLDMIYSYNENKADLVFKGLDGIYVATINYLEFTNFDMNNPFYDEIIPELLVVFTDLTEKFPDYIHDYEKTLLSLINFAYQKNEKKSFSLINQLLNNRASGQKKASDDLGQLALNAAGIMFSFGNNEISYILADIAEENMVWSEIERTHSTAKMMNYLQLSDIYLANRAFDKYDNAMQEADIVFRNHYDTLKNTSYAKAFKNVVITKN